MSEARAYEPNVTRIRTVTVIPPRMKLMQGMPTLYNALADVYENNCEKLRRIAEQKQEKADRSRRIEVFLQMLERQEECLDFDPFTFVALVDKVVVGKDKKTVFCFRNGMRFRYVFTRC